MILLLAACGAQTPATPLPAARSATPPELAGDWYLTEGYQGRRVVAKPCAADLSHLVLHDDDDGAQVAARRVLAVRIGHASAVRGGDGTWTYEMGKEPAWTFSLLDPEGRMLRWTGAAHDLEGPWVRREDVDAYELLRIPEVVCKRPDPLPVWPEGVPRQWWRIQWSDGRWQPAPEPGTLPPLEIVTEGTAAVVNRTGAGETRWPLLVVAAEGDRVDLTLQDTDQTWLGMRIDRRRPPPPPGEVDGAGRLGPVSSFTTVDAPLPEGARFISLPGRPAYTAGVWAPSETVAALSR